MPLYVPPTVTDLADLAERIARQVVDMYSAIEAELVAQIARRILRDLPPNASLAEQLAVIRSLQQTASDLLATIPNDLAIEVVRIAVEQGTAAAAQRLGLAAYLPRTTDITRPVVDSLAMIAADLGSAFDQLHLRILRYPIDAIGNFISTDVYQQVQAQYAPLRMLGTYSTDEVRKRMLAGFLDRGITGFTDRLGRRWRIGSYTEMAIRTTTARAFVDAGNARILSAGVGLVSILGNNDACELCAAWFGKVLSIDGTPAGQYTMEHPTDDGVYVEVEVAATMDDARAAGLMHPNCACMQAAYFPGLSTPTAAPQHDPVAEAGREQQRKFERDIREAKRKLAIAEALDMPDDAAKYEQRVRDRQAEIRALIKETGQKRQYPREQVRWADGPSSRPATPPVPDSPPPTAPPSQALNAQKNRARIVLEDSDG